MSGRSDRRAEFGRGRDRSDPDALRLFVAIELPDKAIRALETVQERLRQVDSEGLIRWSSGDGFHLTLKFLGDAPGEQVSTIRGALADAVKNASPFALTVSGLGGFPDMLTPRVVWAGIQGDLERLNGLQRAVESAIAPLGFPTEARTFSPHLTLGRTRNEASRNRLTAFGLRFAALDVGELASWEVTTVSLMRSELRPSGAVYTELAACALTETARG